MITLDQESLERLKGESYSADRNDRVVVYLDGKKLDCCIYCNVDLGIAIVGQRALHGGLETMAGIIIYKIISGKITVEPLENKQTAT